MFEMSFSLNFVCSINFCTLEFLSTRLILNPPLSVRSNELVELKTFSLCSYLYYISQYEIKQILKLDCFSKNNPKLLFIFIMYKGMNLF